MHRSKTFQPRELARLEGFFTRLRSALMETPAPIKQHMLKEIFEQPQVVTATMRGADGGIAEVLKPALGLAAELKKCQRILIAASGTSRHAGLAGKAMLEGLAGIRTEVDFSSEIQDSPSRFGPETLMVVITQSGETADTLAALRSAKRNGSKVLAIGNVSGGTILREADAGILTLAGPEVAVPSTKAYTAQMATLFLLALWLAGSRKVISQEKAQRYVRELAKVPANVEKVLRLDAECEALARKYKWCENYIFAGRGVHYPIALDGALKLKEVSYLQAEGYPTGELRHGPIAAIDENITVVVLAAFDPGEPESVARYEKTLSVIREIKERKGRVVLLANEGDDTVQAIADDVLRIPPAPEFLLPLLEIVPLQLYAFHTAVLQGRDVDRPRHLSKAVVTE